MTEKLSNLSWPISRQVVSQELVWYPLATWAPAYDAPVLLWNDYAKCPIMGVLTPNGWRIGERGIRWDYQTFQATFTHYACVTGPDGTKCNPENREVKSDDGRPPGIVV